MRILWNYQTIHLRGIWTLSNSSAFLKKQWPSPEDFGVPQNSADLWIFEPGQQITNNTDIAPLTRCLGWLSFFFPFLGLGSSPGISPPPETQEEDVPVYFPVMFSLDVTFGVSIVDILPEPLWSLPVYHLSSPFFCQHSELCVESCRSGHDGCGVGCGEIWFQAMGSERHKSWWMEFEVIGGRSSIEVVLFR